MRRVSLPVPRARNRAAGMSGVLASVLALGLGCGSSRPTASGSGGAAAGASIGATGGASGAGAEGGGGQTDGVPFVYVGSGFYDLTEPRLFVFRLDPETFTLSEVQRALVPAFPSFIAMSPDGSRLYLNVENAPSAAIAFEVGESGELTELRRLATGEDGAAYITLDRSGRFVLQANYWSGSVVVLGTASDGALTGLVDRRDFGADSAYTHCVELDPSNRFAFVTNRWQQQLPGNNIARFSFDAGSGKLTPSEPAELELPVGTGPRHLAFHPSLPVVYVDNETSSTISTYAFDVETGGLSQLDEVGTVPSGFAGKNEPADLRVHPSGAFLYVSNRGPYSIAIFGIDAETGKLTALGYESFAGEPRNLFVDPRGRFLAVGNRGGNEVRLYGIAADGMLSLLGTPAAVASPSGIAVAYRPGP